MAQAQVVSEEPSAGFQRGFRAVQEAKWTLRVDSRRAAWRGLGRPRSPLPQAGTFGPQKYLKQWLQRAILRGLGPEKQAGVGISQLVCLSPPPSREAQSWARPIGAESLRCRSSVLLHPERQLAATRHRSRRLHLAGWELHSRYAAGSRKADASASCRAQKLNFRQAACKLTEWAS